MHEMQTVTALCRKAMEIADKQGAGRVTGVTIHVGALSHLSADHLRGHFTAAAAGSILEAAQLHVSVSSDPADPNAQEVELVSVEVE